MKRILYLTVNQQSYVAKYEAQVEAWHKFGYQCEHYNCSRSLSGVLQLKKIIKDYDVVYARHDFALDSIWLVIRFLIGSRKLILEIPTPINVYVKELKNFPQSRLKNKFRILIMLFCLKQITKRSDLIIELANEINPIVLQHKQKIFMWQNGINFPEKYGLDQEYFIAQHLQIMKFKQIKELRLIIVANLANYHGVERLLNGINAYYLTKPDYKVMLDIVSGDTTELMRIKEIVKQKKMKQYVNFCGYRSVKQLLDIYKYVNFAIGALGSYITEYKHGTPLKVREYTLFGIPSCIDYYDYDLSETEYALHFDQSENAIDLNQIISFYNRLIEEHDVALTQNIHAYAIKNCLSITKINNLINECKARSIL